jgi:hypothetical protein
MQSIKFDNTEINNSTYYPRFAKHESFPERMLNGLALISEDGESFISERFDKKVIPMQGVIVGSSQADVESKKDIMAELFARPEKNLDIDWNGSTRRYVATCTKLEFDRDHFNLNFIPWTAEFTVLSGSGEDTSETTIVNADTFTANYKTKTFTLYGSARPKIRFSIAVNSPNGYIKGIEIKNTTTGERIYVPSSSSLNGKTVEIDTRMKTVTIAGSAVPYFGTFPKFVVGSNTIQISCGDIIDQMFDPGTYNSDYSIYNSYEAVQGFMVPYSGLFYKSIWLKLAYTGNPAVGMDVRIETDNNGVPSGTLVNANATATISSGEMAGGAVPTLYQIFFNGEFALSPNTRYWIVLKPHNVGLDSSNNYQWCYESGLKATYNMGNAAYYDGSWTQYPDVDMIFKLCCGGKYDTGYTQTYSIYQTKKYL